MNLFEEARKTVRHGGLVHDVGAGIRPQDVVTSDRAVCVEPFGPYADKLEAKGLDVIRLDALTFLRAAGKLETVVLLDVIEHLEKADGLEALTLLREKAQQVVIFTPLGFVKQEGDAWRMGGDEWQRHRSGWTPDEFEGATVLVDPTFHRSKGHGAFFAIWQ